MLPPVVCRLTFDLFDLFALFPLVALAGEMDRGEGLVGCSRDAWVAASKAPLFRAVWIGVLGTGFGVAGLSPSFLRPWKARVAPFRAASELVFCVDVGTS